MDHEYDKHRKRSRTAATTDNDTVEPGQSSRSALLGRPAHPIASGLVQRKANAGDEAEPSEVHAAAARGVATASSQLPYLDRIQPLFGRHDISSVQAHTGPLAAASAHAMGAQAYATGNHVVLGEGADLHTVVHETAHVVQQRAGVQLAGGAGVAGDAHERHADAVADTVVSGGSAEALLDEYAERSPLGRRGTPVAIPAPSVVQRKLFLAVDTSRSDARNTLESRIGKCEVQRFHHGETMTNEWGVPSSTTKFKDDDVGAVNGYKEIKWRKETPVGSSNFSAIRIGRLRPIGSIDGNFDPHVKMHLVNSFLHPDANNWKDNWVFGAHDLNSKHSQIEESAKRQHPKMNTDNIALNYRTEVLGTDSTGMSSNELVKKVSADVVGKAIGQFGDNVQTPSESAVRDSVTIGEQSIEDYVTSWNAAVKGSVATKIQVEYQAYCVKEDQIDLGELVTEQATTDTPSEPRIDVELDTLIASGACKLEGGRLTRNKRSGTETTSPP